MSESRACERFPVVSLNAVRDIDSDQLIGHLVDLSREGLRIWNDHSTSLNNTLHLSLELPRAICPRGAILFTCDVIWQRTFDDPQYYHAGLKIRHMNETDREILKNLLHNASTGDNYLSIEDTISEERYV